MCVWRGFCRYAGNEWCFIAECVCVCVCDIWYICVSMKKGWQLVGGGAMAGCWRCWCALNLIWTSWVVGTCVRLDCVNKNKWLPLRAAICQRNCALIRNAPSPGAPHRISLKRKHVPYIYVYNFIPDFVSSMVHIQM